LPSPLCRRQELKIESFQAELDSHLFRMRFSTERVGRANRNPLLCEEGVDAT
jgi:hypothetical protein